GSNIVLRAQWIRRAEHDIGATVAKSDGEISGFGGDVQTRRNANALQRLVLDEFFADALQHRHRLVRPFDALLALIGEFHTLYVTGNLSCSCCSHALLFGCQLPASSFRTYE